MRIVQFTLFFASFAAAVLCRGQKRAILDKMPEGGAGMFARVTSLGVTGLEGYPVTVECDISGGLPQFAIVGRPAREAALPEGRGQRGRYQSALRRRRRLLRSV